MQSYIRASFHSHRPAMPTLISTSTSPYGAAVLRIALGTMWMTHGLLKVLVFTLPGAAKFFELHLRRVRSRGSRCRSPGPWMG